MSFGYVFHAHDNHLEFFYQDMDGQDMHGSLKKYKVIERVEFSETRPIHTTHLWSTNAQDTASIADQAKQCGAMALPYRVGAASVIALHEVNWNATFYQDALDEEFERLRCTVGIPRLAHELTPQRLPLEVGLGHAVSLSKGCYIGQETLTKFAHRGHFPRILVVAKSDPVPEFSDFKSWRIGDLSITSGGEDVGSVTTVTYHEKCFHLLAICRRTDALSLRAHGKTLTLAEFTSQT